MTASKVAELVPKLNKSLVYNSGSEPMIAGLGDQLKIAELSENQLSADFFPNYGILD